MKLKLIGISFLLFCAGGTQVAGHWQRNTFPGQGHVDNGFAKGAGWTQMQAIMDLAVSPLDPNFRVAIENQWGAVYTEDGRNYKPLRMRHIGTPGSSAQSVEFSRYDADTFYLRVAHAYWRSMEPAGSPAGLWRSTDRGRTWEHLYQPPPGGYEFDSHDNAGTKILEDPSPARSSHLYFASTSHGLMRSTDDGATWTSAVAELSNRRIKTMAAAVDPDSSETVLYLIAEKKMPRHNPGDHVLLAGHDTQAPNWAPRDYDARWEFERNLADSVDGRALSGGVAGWTDSTAQGRYAAVFDGSAALGSADFTYSGTHQRLSVSVWVQTTDGGSQTIASYDGGEYWELGTKNGRVEWTVHDSGGSTISLLSSVRIDDGDWHHVAGVFDNGDLRVYVDGEQAAFGSSDAASLGSGNPVAGVVGAGFKGGLDDLRIYNSRALGIDAARGIYLEENKKNPMTQGQLWRVRVDESGGVAEALRLHAPLADFHFIEVNPVDPSQGWLIRKAFPLDGWPFGGRELYRFSDYGETLTPASAERRERQTFDAVLINPGNPNHVFLACGGRLRYGLRWSMDGGESWQGADRAVDGSIPSIQSWLPMHYHKYGQGLADDSNTTFRGTPFAFVPGEPEKLLWLDEVQGGLLESRDYGATWSTAAAGGTNKVAAQISVAHGDTNRWAVGFGEHGWSITTNNGLSWYAATHHNNALLKSLAREAQSDGFGFAATHSGCGVAFHPVNPDIMVATWSMKGYILRSTDAGMTWADTGYRNPMDLWVDVFWSRGDANRVYAGRMKSDDAGRNWTDIGKVVISVCDSDSDLIVGVDDWQRDVTADSLNMHLSVDGGSSWTILPDPPRETVPGTEKEWLVTGTARKWNTMADALVAIDPGAERPRILLAGRSGIYEYSEESGEWTLRDTGLEANRHSSVIEPVPWMGFVAFDPRPGFEHVVYAAKQNDDRTMGAWAGEGNPNRAYPGGENSEPFYRSTDGGITWQKLHGENHPEAPSAAMIESMTVDMLGRMFAATTEGIYIFKEAQAEKTAETVEFVSGEGYADGELIGQLTWTGAAGNYSVDAHSPGALAVGPGSWSTAVYGPGLGSASVLKLGTEFSFTEGTVPDVVENAFRIQFGSPDGEAASLSLIRRPSGMYQLRFRANSAETSSYSGNFIDAHALGAVGGSGSASDSLYMQLSLFRGGDEGGWTAEGLIYNRTSDPDQWYAPLDYFTFPFSSSKSFFDGALSAGLNSASQFAANIADLKVHSLRVAPAASPFAKWIFGYGLSGADAEKTADPDGDGIVNLAEYALGGDPSGQSGFGVRPHLDSNMNYVYRRRTDDDGLRYRIETSTDLVSNVWSTDGIREIAAEKIDGQFEWVASAVDEADDPRKFIRMIIEYER